MLTRSAGGTSGSWGSTTIRLIPGLKRMTDAVHAHGAKMAAHLYAAGREASSYITGRQPIAPSNVPCKVLAGGDIPKELTLAEIREQIELFGEAARRAVEAGFDVIMVHGAHGYIIGQFFSPFSNKRTDRYGGSIENRMRFPLEVVAKVRSVVGDNVPIAYRMSADEKLEGGVTVDDSIRLSVELEKAGVDLIDVSSGIYESIGWIAQSMAYPRGCLVEDGWKIKQNVEYPRFHRGKDQSSRSGRGDTGVRQSGLHFARDGRCMPIPTGR